LLFSSGGVTVTSPLSNTVDFWLGKNPMATWQVPLITQNTVKLCWEACARMMWKWRYKNLNDYSAKAGNYLKLDKGLDENEMDVFYNKLGLRSLQSPKSANVIWALKWTPVILTDVNQDTGHAVVASGFEKNSFTLANPCATLSLDFDGGADSCVAGVVKVKADVLGAKLGKFIWYW
jgi:hypothetical protein